MTYAYYLINRHILIYKTHVSKGAQSIHILCSVKLQFCNFKHVGQIPIKPQGWLFKDKNQSPKAFCQG